jgi:WD40 repeat protein
MKAFAKTLILLIGFILIVTVFAEDSLPANLSPIYDADNLNPLMRFGQGWANDIIWSPDGTKVAVATSIGVWLYDASNLQAEPILLNDTVFSALAVEFSHDGQFLGAAGGSGLIVWDANSHELVRSFDTENVLDLAFSRDNSLILSSDSFGAESYGVDVWELETGRQLTTLDRLVFVHLVFSPDGNYVAGVRLAHENFTTFLWETSTWTPLLSNDVEVRADDERVAFSPDSQSLVAMDRTGSFTVLNVQSQSVITTVTLDTEQDEWRPVEAAFSPDGRQFMSLSNLGILRVWETESYTSIATVELNWNPYVARLSPDRTQIAAIDRAGSLRIWDVATGDLVAQRDNFALDDPLIAFSPDGSLLASGARAGEIWLWDVATATSLFVLSGHEGQLLSLDFSSDGAFLASSSRDGTVKLWDMATRSLSRILAERDHAINTVIIDSQNQVLIADEQLIQISDLTSGEPILWFHDEETASDSSELEMESSIRAIDFEGTHLAVATANGQIKYWDSRGSWDVSRNFYHLRVNTLIVNESSVSYAGDNSVVLDWGVSQGTRILSPHNSWIFALAYNPQTFTIASAGCAETLRSPWDGSLYCGGAELRIWDYMRSTYGEVSQEEGHVGSIQAAAFNTDGTLLATASADGTILLWGNPAHE